MSDGTKGADTSVQAKRQIARTGGTLLRWNWGESEFEVVTPTRISAWITQGDAFYMAEKLVAANEQLFRRDGERSVYFWCHSLNEHRSSAEQLAFGVRLLVPVLSKRLKEERFDYSDDVATATFIGPREMMSLAVIQFLLPPSTASLDEEIVVVNGYLRRYMRERKPQRENFPDFGVPFGEQCAGIVESARRQLMQEADEQLNRLTQVAQHVHSGKLSTVTAKPVVEQFLEFAETLKATQERCEQILSNLESGLADIRSPLAGFRMLSVLEQLAFIRELAGYLPKVAFIRLKQLVEVDRRNKRFGDLEEYKAFVLGLREALKACRAVVIFNGVQCSVLAHAGGRAKGMIRLKAGNEVKYDKKEFPPVRLALKSPRDKSS